MKENLETVVKHQNTFRSAVVGKVSERIGETEAGFPSQKVKKSSYRSSRPEVFLGKGKFSCKFAAYFQNTFPKNTSGGLLTFIVSSGNISAISETCP